MARKSLHQKRKLFQLLIQYGFHLWILIFVSNVVIFYGVRFFIRASTDTQPQQPNIESTLPAITTAPTIPIATPTPVGPAISLSFKIPGISSIGGNIKPRRPERDVVIYLYAPNANTADKNVRPLYSISSRATYVDDPSNPMYSSFFNPSIDLGLIEKRSYQIAFKTPQALLQLIRNPETQSAGGTIYEISKSSTPRVMPTQTLVTGDIYPVPESDNIMDMNDYTMLTNCFGEKAFGNGCISGSNSDLDDNGTVDGIDYNIMFLSFLTLKERGLPVPEIDIDPPILINQAVTTPTSEPIQNDPDDTPTAAPDQSVSTNRKSGGSMGIILFIIFLLILFVGGGFAILRFHLLDKFLKKAPPQKTEPAQQQSDSVQGNASPEALPPDTAQSTPPEPSTAPQPVSTDTTPEQNTNPQSVNLNNSLIKPADASGAVEKSGYLKKVSVDEQLQGAWVTIADDSGISRGFYKGDVTDGFVKIKGSMKKDAENKDYIEISELTPEA